MFALKVFAPGKDVITDELRVLTTLDHPHIIQCYGGFRFSGSDVIVYELCEGGTLADVIAEHASGLPAELFLALCTTDCSRLAFCHSRGIGHCDVNPKNVLFREVERRTVKLVAFGPADAGVFSAPEVFTGGARDPQQLDVWALGITFLMMMNGHSPFATVPPEQLRQVIIDGTFSSDVADEELRPLIKTMLDVNPERRITMAELAAQRVMRPLAAPVPTAAPRMSRLGVRGPARCSASVGPSMASLPLVPIRGKPQPGKPLPVV
jgi:serine/threonine-protein kinase